MRERALVHVAGPKGAGKTTFIEATLGALGFVLAARCVRDDSVFDAIIGFRGSRIPVTAVVANLADPRDAGTKKAVARVRRALRTRS